MIREAQRSELPALLELWLESTTWGHPFIKSSYWRDCIPLVRDAYLANAQNWVWEEDGKLLGFVSIMEGRFLAAMFVAPKAVRRGIGKGVDMALYTFWGFKLDASVFLYIDSPKEALASVSVGFILLGAGIGFPGLTHRHKFVIHAIIQHQ